MTPREEAALFARIAPSWAYLSLLAVGAVLTAGIAAWYDLRGWNGLYNLWSSGFTAGALAVFLALRAVAWHKAKAVAAGVKDDEWAAMLRRSTGPRRPF